MLQSDAVIFQVNFDNSHWALGVIYGRTRSFTLLDSSRNAAREEAFKSTMTAFLCWICHALGSASDGMLFGVCQQSVWTRY